MIGLHHYMIVSAMIFTCGLVAVLTRRHAIGILMGVELMLNAANLNFVAINRYSGGAALSGQVFALFVIVIAAAEAAVALAIFLNFYTNFASIDVERASDLQG